MKLHRIMLNIRHRQVSVVEVEQNKQRFEKLFELWCNINLKINSDRYDTDMKNTIKIKQTFVKFVYGG